jgi:hypothetical protein
MNVNIAADALLIGAAGVWVLARQVRAARVKPRLLWLAPLVLGYFGLRALPASTWHMAAELGLVALGAAVSVGLGVWRGQTIRVWREADGAWWRQGSVRTLALWGALIVARGLLYGLDAATGHRDASGLGAILVTLAFSFAAQNAVIATRMSGAQTLGSGVAAEPGLDSGPGARSRLTDREGLHARRHERIQARRLERQERRAARSWR